uniref:Uncharacterized protein n=1 Tax=Lepeophtheirus salmonis TaxID=72036 RepID=A0A0K2TA08_LEPSM
MATKLTFFDQNPIILGIKSLFHSENILITKYNAGRRASPQLLKNGIASLKTLLNRCCYIFNL